MNATVWVLIICTYMTNTPPVVVAAFTNEPACEAAAKAVRDRALLRDDQSGRNFVRLDGICVPTRDARIVGVQP